MRTMPFHIWKQRVNAAKALHKRLLASRRYRTMLRKEGAAPEAIESIECLIDEQARAYNEIRVPGLPRARVA